jgi:hypothetical protein
MCFSAVVHAISLRSQLWLWLHAVRVLTCVPYCTQGLLSAPNPDDPLDNNAADHWKRNEADAVMKGSAADRCVLSRCVELHRFCALCWRKNGARATAVSVVVSTANVGVMRISC